VPPSSIKMPSSYISRWCLFGGSAACSCSFFLLEPSPSQQPTANSPFAFCYRREHRSALLLAIHYLAFFPPAANANTSLPPSQAYTQFQDVFFYFRRELLRIVSCLANCLINAEPCGPSTSAREGAGLWLEGPGFGRDVAEARAELAGRCELDEDASGFALRRFRLPGRHKGGQGRERSGWLRCAAFVGGAMQSVPRWADNMSSSGARGTATRLPPSTRGGCGIYARGVPG
jgi:hypothetical protein